MTKMNTQLTLLLGLLFLTNGLIAQTPFWSEDFSDATILDSWTNEDQATNTDNEGNAVLALWEHCSTPATCPPAIFSTLSGDPLYGEFNAATAANGYVFMNADTLGELEMDFVSQLTTDVIDCTGKTAVYIKFASHIATYNNNAAEHAVLRVSTSESDWQTFTIYPELTDDNLPLGSDNPHEVIIDISAVAADMETVYVQWQWTGNDDWSWSLDDVELYDEDPTETGGPIWSEDFNGGLNGWTTNAVLNDYVWEFSEDGDVSNGAYAANGTILSSPTQENGCMALNADFLQTGGVALPAGSQLEDAVTELISPIIDLSDVSTALGLEFYQLIRRLNPVQGNFFSSFSISEDGGNTWGDPIDANPTLAPNDDPLTGRMYFPLGDLSGEDSLRIKFTYAGDFYYWVLDDISIIERPLHDMQANENYFAIPTNFTTPLSQVEPIYFLSDIQNVGGADQNDVELSVTITKDQNEEVFSSVEEYGTIVVDSLAENVIFNETFTPTETGTYQGVYEVSSAEEDSQPDNNTLSFSFTVSDTTFAKENGAQGGTRPVDDNSYTFGNVFYVPNGEGWYARYISFQYSNPETLAAAGKEVTTYLYKWDGTGVESFMANRDDMEFLSFNSYRFEGDESGLITIPINLDNETFELESGYYYLAVVEYTTTDETYAFMGVNRNNNYLANYFLQDSLEMPRFASALDVGNTGTFDFRGFGFGAMPVVRMHIGTNPDINGPAIVSTQEVLAEDNLIHLYPNPSSDRIQLELDLTEQSHKVTVNIFDAQGRQLMKKQYENLQKETLNYSIKTLAPGNYYLQIVTDQGTRAKRFVVQR